MCGICVPDAVTCADSNHGVGHATDLTTVIAVVHRHLHTMLHTKGSISSIEKLQRP